ncbi:hypothetical protein [Microcoleus sp. bin38.metabat.b11b12b14.051]|uniref:hypothetical protein n=1 Tax=Microcoleus sp. bin38.metabat.b11b12b14.051 TaxID=2742709 RepID=UPI0025EC3B1C|nr:hypothetical protein [Microcoleus sp. bin38.metabat.b11b12b14.051]
MSDPKDTARYDVSTDTNNSVQSSFATEGSRETTIRDNNTGKDYRGTGSTDKESRDSAWDSVRRDNG